MNGILANYDEERIREFADEGEEGHRDHQQPIYCAECGDEPVNERGDVCAVCTADPQPEVLPSNLYTEIMGVCAKVLDHTNENVKQWDVLACVRDIAQMALAAKEKEAA